MFINSRCRQRRDLIVFLPYSKQFIDEDDINAVADALRSPLITQGPNIEEFEHLLASYCGVQYGVALNSGTSALHAAMYALEIKSGDEVITTPITFVATANAAVYMGARPVFVDIDPDTYCIDMNKIEAAITAKTKAITVVDFAGYPFDIARLRKLADKHNLYIIEDAAHSLGAYREGKPVGSEADITMFSFHPVKHITTGEGGVLATNNKKWYEKMKSFRSHGIVKGEQCQLKNQGNWYYEMLDMGYNYRITSIQCALGISQFKKLEGFITCRIQQADYYDRAFKNNPLITIPPRPVNGRHVFHLYPILLNLKTDRRKVYDYLQAQGIGVQVHYIPVHTQPYYQNHFGYKYGDFPVSEDYYQRTLSLPLYPGLKETEQDYVVKRLQEII